MRLGRVWVQDGKAVHGCGDLPAYQRPPPSPKAMQSSAGGSSVRSSSRAVKQSGTLASPRSWIRMPGPLAGLEGDPAMPTQCNPSSPLALVTDLNESLSSNNHWCTRRTHGAGGAHTATACAKRRRRSRKSRLLVHRAVRSILRDGGRPRTLAMAAEQGRAMQRGHASADPGGRWIREAQQATVGGTVNGHTIATRGIPAKSDWRCSGPFLPM